MKLYQNSKNKITAFCFVFYVLPSFSQIGPSCGYSTTVPIEVPGFHGIEPSLAITYNSLQNNGILGVGWKVSNFSSIKRKSKGKGVSNYDNNDIFYLDGMELIPCGDVRIISPSCEFPASPQYKAYYTKIESYQRIAFSPTAGTAGVWYLWTKAGIKITYEPRVYSSTNSGNLRVFSWDITYVEDPVGNKIKYTYWQDNATAIGVGEIYLDEIIYTGAVIKFYYEKRPDIITYGIAEKELVVVKERLKNIDIQSAGSRSRCYELKYLTGSGNGQSILSQVQQFGSDAQLNNLGEVINAQSIISFPPITFETDESSGNNLMAHEENNTQWGLPIVNGPLPPVFSGASFTISDPKYMRFTPSNLGDFDGNGQTDWLQAAPSLLFNPNAHIDELLITTALAGKSPPVYIQQKLIWPFGGLNKESIVADVNGDGRSDLVFIILGQRLPGVDYSFNAYFIELAVAISNGDGTFYLATSVTQTTQWETEESVVPSRAIYCRVGDVDGDNKDDILCSFTKSDGSHFIGTAISKSDGTFTVSEMAAPFAKNNITRQMDVGDSNGDGLSDMMFLDFPDCSTGSPQCVENFELVTALSNGINGFIFDRQVTNWELGSPSFFAADINGDGKSDYVLFKSILANSTSSGGIQTAIRRPDGGFSLSEQQISPTLISIENSVSIGDANGDGKIDLMVASRQVPNKTNCSASIQNTHANLHRVLSRGNGFFDLPSSWEDCSNSVEVNIPWADLKYTPIEPQAPDVNGDGTADFEIALAKLGVNYTTLNEDLSSNPKANTYNWIPAEVNGDGRKDWIYFRSTASGLMISTLLSNSNSYDEKFTGTIPNTEKFSCLRNWKVMDVNADGLDDLVYGLYLNPTDGVQINTFFSNGDGTWRYTSQNVLIGLTEILRDTPRWLPIDVTGDGKIDLVYISVSNNSLSIRSLISNGDGTWIEKQQDVIQNWSKPDVLNWKPAEINGDGRIDLVYLENINGEINVYSILSDGDGNWKQAPSSPSLFQLNTIAAGNELTDIKNWKIMDANGDGLSDLVHLTPTVRNPTQPSSLLIYTLFSNGDGGWTSRNSQPIGSYVGDMQNWHTANMNSDNNIDLINTNISSPGITVSALSLSIDGDWYLGNPTVLISNATRTRDLHDVYFKTADVDGNGQDDLTLFDINSYTNGMQQFSILSNYPLNLLNREHNMNGGTLFIEYQPSSKTIGNQKVFGPSGKNFLPGGLNFNTVSAIKISGGHLGTKPYNLSFNYSSAIWSYTERMLLGCEEVFIHRDSIPNRSGSTTLNSYRISEECIAQPILTGTYSAAGKWIDKKITSYIFPGVAPPYKNLINYVNEIELNSQNTGLNNYTQYLYDNFGNNINTSEHGNIFIPDDDRTTLVSFKPNTRSYIVGLPWQITVNEGALSGGVGIGTGIGKAFRYKYLCYDGDNGSEINNCPGLPIKGLLTRIQQVDDLGLYNNTTFEFDLSGNILSESNPRHFGKAFFYDPTYHLYPTANVDAVNNSLFTDWDFNLGRIKKITDANNGIITVENDVLGRIRTIIAKDGPTVKFEYSNWGNPNLQKIRESISDGSMEGLWTDTYYDGLGRYYRIVKKGIVAGKDFTKDINYADETTNIYSLSNWYVNGETIPIYEQMSYDAIGRPLKQSHPDCTTIKWEYGNDATMSWVSSFDELGHKKTAFYDTYKRIIKIEENVNNQTINTRYSYNCVDELLSITDANGNVTKNTWNILGQRTEMDDPDMGVWHFKYDGAGNLARQIDAKGDTTLFSYDGIDRIESKIDKSKRTINWNYGQLGHGAGFGKLTSVSESPGAYTSSCPNNISEDYTYDLMGHITSFSKCIDGFSYIIQYEYDSVGRIKKLIYPDKEGVIYNYNPGGLLKSIPGYLKEMMYDADGNVLNIVYENDVSEKFGYNVCRQWLTGSTVNSSRQLMFDVNYEYGKSGLIKSSSSKIKNFELWYRYDELNRLTRISGTRAQQLSYDNIGNISYNSDLGAYSYYPNKPHILSRAGQLTLGYDLNGNLSSIFNSNTQKGRNFDWTSDNKPLVILDTNNISTYHSYDAWNNLVKRQRNSDITRYYNPLFEYSSSKGLVKYYFAGSKIIAHQNNSGTYWYHQDNLGSTRLITDKNGNEINSYDYTVLGSTINHSGLANTDIQYSSHYVDNDNELINMNARYYDPKLGKFISADPTIPNVYNPQSLNPYSYAYNNPISLNDPSGLQPADAEIEIKLNSSYGSDFSSGLDYRLGNYADYRMQMSHDRSAPGFGEVLDYFKSNIGQFMADPAFTMIFAKGAEPAQILESERITKGMIDYERTIFQMFGMLLGGGSLSGLIVKPPIPMIGIGVRVFPKRIYEGRAIFNFTKTAASHMEEPGRMIPVQTLEEIINAPMAAWKDPSSATNAIMYYSRLKKFNKLYNVEVLYDRATNTIYHFQYSSDALGPMEKIPKDLLKIP